LTGHYLADFPMQPDFMAKNKLAHWVIDFGKSSQLLDDRFAPTAVAGRQTHGAGHESHMLRRIQEAHNER
jgi:hypothetical protein